ncbi:MAG: hypothetical protein GY807_23895 [Gammaproteobacteria bacterium]|nr:hypothetical protein [Gammaproteobacteria bacterium]
MATRSLSSNIAKRVLIVLLTLVYFGGVIAADNTKIRYFGSLHSFEPYRFDDIERFQNEFQFDQIDQDFAYFKARFENDVLVSAETIYKNQTTEFYEFDSLGRMTLIKDSEYTCEIKYGEQIKETRCTDDHGRKKIFEKSYYVNNYLHKLERYANERVFEYIIFDHNNGVQQKYDGAGRFISQRQLH